jgi:hypothetical protein
MGKKDGVEAGWLGPVSAKGNQALPLAVARGSVGMDALRELLEELRRQDAIRQHFLGLLHILIGRRISRPDGTVISSGMTWRELSALVRKLRWDKKLASQVGVKSDDLPPRDRERYWYIVIARAGVDSARAQDDAERLAGILRQKGYVVSPAPGK